MIYKDIFIVYPMDLLAAFEIFNTATEILRSLVPVQVRAQQYQPVGRKGLLTVMGIGPGVVALVCTNDYNDNVGRYHDLLGHFTS